MKLLECSLTFLHFIKKQFWAALNNPSKYLLNRNQIPQSYPPIEANTKSYRTGESELGRDYTPPRGGRNGSREKSARKGAGAHQGWWEQRRQGRWIESGAGRRGPWRRRAAGAEGTYRSSARGRPAWWARAPPSSPSSFFQRGGRASRLAVANGGGRWRGGRGREKGAREMDVLLWLETWSGVGRNGSVRSPGGGFIEGRRGSKRRFGASWWRLSADR